MIRYGSDRNKGVVTETVIELIRSRALCVGNNNWNNNFNSRNNLDNNARFVRIAKMKNADTDNLYAKLCSLDNLCLAFKKARKYKSQKPDVVEFEKNLFDNLHSLRFELLFHTYKPKPLKVFVIRDPKTRKISKSDFRDRVVHHALCNVIEPVFEKAFIYDSYANRMGKGTLAAIKRFEYFQKKVTRNNTVRCFVLKADIKHYFQTINHTILLKIIECRINDARILWAIKQILRNHQTDEPCKGMPLGNLTSQFFANVYLNELDQFVKHELKTPYYLRYVDDFIILHNSESKLYEYKQKIDLFLKTRLALELHPEKSKVHPIGMGTGFLGLRIFMHHKLLQKKNLRRFKTKVALMCAEYEVNGGNYDQICDFLEGWIAYSKNANTHNLRRKLFKPLAEKFQGEISTIDLNRYLKFNKNKLRQTV